MEYGSIIQEKKLVGSDLETKHPGFTDFDLCLRQYFSQNTIHTISHKLTQLLMGVDPQNRPIIIPDKQIGFVMDSVYRNFTPYNTGDIYTRYNIPSGSNTDSYVQNMIDQVIEIIYSDVRNNLEIEQNNSKLSIWTTVLGEGLNQHQLRSFAPIKTRLKRPAPFQFNMNY